MCIRDRYEISNYAKEGKECRHNLAYWNMDNWIGVGSAAASYINGKRIKNISSVEEYINSINELSLIHILLGREK